jgi:hypothetical protein
MNTLNQWFYGVLKRLRKPLTYEQQWKYNYFMKEVI